MSEKVEREYWCSECHSRATVRAVPDVDVFLNCSGENNEHRLVIMEEVDNG